MVTVTMSTILRQRSPPAEGCPTSRDTCSGDGVDPVREYLANTAIQIGHPDVLLQTTIWTIHMIPA